VQRERWLIRPIPAAAALLAACALSLYFLQRASLGPSREQRLASYTVLIECAGVDSGRIERAITMPLEDEVAGIPGIVEIRSVSEYGKSRVTVVASEGEQRAELSLRLRDAVERVYGKLPLAAQKPEILSSSLSQRPVFVASVRAAGGAGATGAAITGGEELRELVERAVKPGFARIPGVGEIEAGGGAAREVHVRVDSRKAALRGLSLADVAGQIARQSLLAPAGTLRAAGRQMGASVAGRMGAVGELARLPIALPDTAEAIALCDIAEVENGFRERDSVSRVDGREAVVISVQSSGTANLIALSRGLRAETARWEARGLAFDVILDQGRALERAAGGIISSLLQGLLVVTAVLPLFVHDARRIGVLAAALPLTGLIVVAALAAAGISLDQYVLAGLAVGIGTILDTGIIVSEQRTVRQVHDLAPSLAASLATTLIVLVPLLFLEFVSAGIRQVAIAIALLLVVSFALDMLFLPAFFLAGTPPWRKRRPSMAAARRAGASRKASRRALRLLHQLIEFTIRRRALVLAGAAALVCAMGAALLLGEKDFSPPVEDSSIYAHVEFEPGATVDSVDERVAQYARSLKGAAGIGMIESIARRDSAEMQVSFDPGRTSRSRVAAIMRDQGERIPGGFVYLPEGAPQTSRGIEIAIRGDDDALLRDLARDTAHLLGGQRWVRQVVLNFKNAPPALIVTVDHHRAAELGVRAAEVAGALRWALHGPVALKWIEDDREIDLRVMETGARHATRADILAVPVRNSAGAVRPVSGLATLEVRAEGGKIFRKDRQRAVYLTVHAAGGTVEAAVGRIRETLAGVALPPGYAFELDREVRELNDSFRLLWIALGLSAVFIYVVLAGFGESLGSPIAVLSILPTSLAFPVVAYALLAEPIRVPILVGFIMLSGMVVNNSILVIDAIRDRLRVAGMQSALHGAIRGRIRPLLITSVATIAGTIPLLFARSQGAGFLSALAFVVFWGMLGSLASTILIVPALAAAAPRLFAARSAVARAGRGGAC
jgi:HAE1 family hydrophobic/amphiphilic exporter-1